MILFSKVASKRSALAQLIRTLNEQQRTPGQPQVQTFIINEESTISLGHMHASPLTFPFANFIGQFGGFQRDLGGFF